MALRMNSPGASGLEHSRRDSWLYTANSAFREYITASNLVGLIGVLVLLFLLLVPPFPWNFRLPLYLAVLIWTMLRPRVALYLLPFCIPWGSVDFINLGQLRLNSADILVVFLALGWLMSCALPANSGLRDRESSDVPTYLVLAMFALLGTMLLSMTVAINISSSLKEISKWLEFLVLVLLGSQYLRTRRQVWTVIILICIAGITQAIFGYIQASYNLGPQSFLRAASLRVYGTFDQPNPFAGYINVPLSIVLALALLGRDWLTRVLAGTTVILLAIAEYLSQSRGGEMAIAAALAFIIVHPNVDRVPAMVHEALEKDNQLRIIGCAQPPDAGGDNMGDVCGKTGYVAKCPNDAVPVACKHSLAGVLNHDHPALARQPLDALELTRVAEHVDRQHGPGSRRDGGLGRVGIEA